MDIYSFIRSPEVAEHCRKIGKTWNTLEMAVIIDRGNRTTAESGFEKRESSLKLKTCLSTSFILDPKDFCSISQ